MADPHPDPHCSPAWVPSAAGISSLLRAPRHCSKVRPCRDGRVGGCVPPALLRPQSAAGPPGDMARFVLNCLLSFDALESIWFKGECLLRCNLWLPGGGYS